MIQFSTAIRDARLQAIVSATPVGSKIKLYSGTRPTAGGAETTTLAELLLTNPVGTVNNGVLTFSPISNDVSADDTGVVTWGRIVDNNGLYLMDFSCGTVASSAELKFPTVNFTQGGVIRIASFVITEGNV